MEQKVEKQNKKNLIIFVIYGISVLLLLFYIPLIGILVGMVGGLILIDKNQKETDKKSHREIKITEANVFMDEVKIKKSLPVISTKLFLDNGEYAILEANTHLLETRAVRNSGGSGIGFRIAKGITIGSYSGQSESHREWRKIDDGMLTLTNKRLIFSGGMENRTIPINKILSLKATFYSNEVDMVELIVDGKSKNIAFPVENVYIWGGSIQIVKGAKDPVNLGNMKIDIEFT
jgi:hypothetical protein